MNSPAVSINIIPRPSTPTEAPVASTIRDVEGVGCEVVPLPVPLPAVEAKVASVGGSG